MKSSKLTHTLCRFALPSAIVAGGLLTSCEDDLLTGTPSWLGSSIYAELEERGNFTQELALINDPALSEYPRILQLTGSKTLFVADDNAWAEFFKNNKWGARSLAELSTAQKQMLLKSSMIDNAYLIELLSNKAGNPPEEGGCVRRESSASLYDSIPHIATADLPNTQQWAHLKATKDSIYMFSAQSLNDVPPMLHFLPDFMKVNNFTNEDISVITNGVLTSTSGSYVNGQLVRENSNDEINRDITCQNGYMHIVEGVPYQLDNMADLVASKPQLSTFSRMLDRYSTPVGVGLLNHDDGTQDSLYVKRYFNTATNSEFMKSSTDAEAITSQEALNMDPGWNNFVLANQNSITYVSDGGCLLVPTNEALEEYARSGGKPLIDRFGSWDNVPLGTLNKLINNHMQTSMKIVVPSKFYAVTNTVGDSLGITTADIDSCFVACNGLVYQINRVYVAPEYVAVSFPTQVRLDLGVSKFATESKDNLLNFQAYLTSTNSKYGFIIPNDEAYQHYINPTSYALDNQLTEWALSMKQSDKDLNLQVKITTTTNLNNGRVQTQTKIEKSKSGDYIVRALRDIMQNHILVLDKEKMFTDQQKIYTNMAGGPVRIDNAGSWNNLGTEGLHNIHVSGSQLMEKGQLMAVDSVYIMGNGVSFVVTESPLHTTATTPYAALADTLNHPAYEEFFKLVDGSNLKIAKLKEGTNEHAMLGTGLSCFNNYHYTVYVPSNASIQRLTDKHILARWSDVELLENYAKNKYAMPQEPVKPDPSDSKYVTKPAQYDKDLAAYNKEMDQYPAEVELYKQKKDQLDSLAAEWNYTLLDESDDEYYNDLSAKAKALRQRLEDFITYHIQDNALYLEGTEQKGASYETSCLDPLIFNEEGDVIGGTGRYRQVQVNYDYNTMTITPVWNRVPMTQYTRTVKAGENSNVVTRQYVYDSSDAKKAEYIYSSSYVVIHEIDEPLYINETYVP